MDKASENYTWRATIDEDGVLTLPDEVIAQLGWKDADEFEWIDQSDGSFLLVKINDSNGSHQASNDAGND